MQVQRVLSKTGEIALGFALPTVYWAGWSDFANAPKWILLLLVLPWCVKLPRTTPAFTCLLAWVLLAVLSLVWTPTKSEGLFALMQLLLFVGAYTIGQYDEVPLLLGLMAGAVANSLLAVAQTFGFEGVPQAIAQGHFVLGPAGMLGNKNFLAEFLAPILVLAVIGKKWLLAGVVGLGLALTYGRAAMLGVALALLIPLWSQHKGKITALGTLGLGTVVLFVDKSTLFTRFSIWEQTIAHLRWFGHGIGAFYTEFPVGNTTYNLWFDRPATPHNELLGLAFEYGLLSIVPITFFVLTLFPGGPSGNRLALIAAYAAALFAFPLHNPVTLVLMGLLAGSLDFGRASVGDLLHDWRVAIHARTGNAYR